MGLHISRIEVRNFRNFKHLVIEKFPARAVITGENGVGKSNLLEALRLVLDPSLPNTRRRLRDEDIWDGHPSGLAAGVEVFIAIELQGYDDDDAAKAILGTDFTVSQSPLTARLTYRFAPKPDLGILTGAHVSPRPLTAQDYDFIVFGGLRETTEVWPIQRDLAVRVLPALRDAENDLKNWRRSPLRDLLERLPLDDATLMSTTAAITEAVDQLTKDANVAKLQEHLTRRFGAMLGQRMAVEPTLGFASSQPDELIRSVRLFLDAERRRGVSEASLGSANVIYLGLLLEVLAQQRKDDQFVASVVAVEEPEAHIYVSLQRHLFRYLLRSESALLLTTHSPNIAAVAPIGSFVVLRATDAGTVGYSTVDLPVTPAEAEDLERYLDVTRAEVLFSTAVILVEGLGEIYIIPALASAAGFDLDAYGVVVASVHGTDFKPYRTLLGTAGLNTPHVIITDGDATPDARKYEEAGIKRGAKLLTGTVATAMMTSITNLPPRTDPARASQREAIVAQLRDEDIFVGAQTLETDLCAVFGPEIIAAFNELNTYQAAQDDVRDGVTNETAPVPDPALRKAMMDRIGNLSKGRFAQRLASHIARLDLPTRLAEVAGAQDGDDVETVLGRLGPASYLFQALNKVSRSVRGTALYPNGRETSIGEGPGQADHAAGH